jgi:hypothetical protein
LDHTFASQGLQVFFSGIGGFEAKFGGDFSPRGWCTGVLDGGLDQVQNLLLAGGELDRFHGAPAQSVGLRIQTKAVWISSNCIFNQFLSFGKHAFQNIPKNLGIGHRWHHSWLS